MTKKIILIAEARFLRLKRYYTGKPCKNGHISERAVVNGTCIACQYAGVRLWAKKNPDKVRKLGRESSRRRRKNPAIKTVLNEKMKEWRSRPENKEKERISSKLYKQKNKLKMRLKENRRRSRLRNNGGHHTEEQIFNLLKKQNFCCIYCSINIEKSFQVDHRIPISRGGSNYISNIDLLCRPCNSRKQAQDPIVWAQKNGRLL